MYHILVLLVAITGQPVGIAHAPGDAVYADKAACEAAISETLVTAQKLLDENENEAVRGKFAVAEAKCFSDAEIDKLQHPDHRDATRAEIGEERVD